MPALSPHWQNPPTVGAFDDLELVKLAQLGFQMPAPQAARPSLAARKFATGDSNVNAFPVDPDNGQAVNKENPLAWHTVLPFFSTRSRSGVSQTYVALIKHLTNDSGGNIA